MAYAKYYHIENFGKELLFFDEVMEQVGGNYNKIRKSMENQYY